MLNELSSAVVTAVGVDWMVPNHNLPLCLGSGQVALKLHQVCLPGLLRQAACIQYALSLTRSHCACRSIQTQCQATCFVVLV